MDLSIIRTFFLSTTTNLFQIIFFLKFKPQIQLPETAVVAGEAHQFPQSAAAAARLIAIEQRVNQELTMIAIGFCLASAIDIALLTVQIKPELVSTLPFLSMLIFLACSSLWCLRKVWRQMIITLIKVTKTDLFIPENFLHSNGAYIWDGYNSVITNSSKRNNQDKRNN